MVQLENYELIAITETWDMTGTQQLSLEDNFLVQVSDKLTRDEILLDLVLTNAVDEHIKGDKIRSSLSCNNHPDCVHYLKEFGPGKEPGQDPELSKRGIPTLGKN